MPRFDASTAECLILTYKEGVLSAVAHDLKLRVGRFEVDIQDDEGDAPSVSASFDPRSITVVCARRDGRDEPGLLSSGDRRKIEDNIAREVLDTSRFPDIRFRSTKIERSGDRARIVGRLGLHGREREIAFDVGERDGKRVAEYRLHQPDFGVRPYTAMLGTLRIKPDVTVIVGVPPRG
jgi:polyisoprenoid-binding protein YceI